MADAQKPIVVFACRWCSLLGAERAGREHLPVPAGLRVIPVACAGGVSPERVVEAFANGAAGVAVMGCHMGGCRHNDANAAAHARLSALPELLDAAGISRERLLISWGTAHEAAEYSALTMEFAARIAALPGGAFPDAGRPAALSGRAPLSRIPADSEADEALRALARKELEAGRCVLGLTADGGALPEPFLFTDAAELPMLTAGPRRPVAKTAGLILRELSAGKPEPSLWEAGIRDEAVRHFGGAMPEAGLAVACRACDARALRSQAGLSRFPMRALHMLPIACSDEQAALCGCTDRTWPAEAGMPDSGAPAPAAEPAPVHDWRKEFTRCAMCFSCRAACPVCVCTECSVEKSTNLPAGSVPPSAAAFHLVRAMHVAHSCVCCGACQDACPQGLPLMELHRAVRRGRAAAAPAAIPSWTNNSEPFPACIGGQR